jgi:nitroreductase
MSVIDVQTTEFEALRKLLAERHSVRGFLPQSVEPETIRLLLETAQRSPSWCNSQPWHLIVTSGEETERFRDALSAYAASHRSAPDFGLPTSYDGVYRERRRESGWALYGAVGIERGDREASARQAAENFRLFGAPHVVIVTTDRNLGVPGAMDCGVWLGSFLLAAQSLGIGAIPQAALAMHPDFIREHFGLDDSRLVVFGVSLGYEDSAHPANAFRVGRAALDEAVRLVG